MTIEIAAGAMAAAGAHSSVHGFPVASGALVCGVVVAGLTVRAKFQRRRLHRSYTRAMSSGSARRQIRAFEKGQVLRKAHAASRAKWAVRKAVVIAVAIGALAVWVHMQAGR